MTARHPLPEPPAQVVTIDAGGGTITLTYSGQQTAPLPFDASPDDVRRALEALSRVGAGNVTVGGAPGGPFVLRFGGALSGRDIAVVEVDDAALEGRAQVTTLVASSQE